MSSRMRYLVTVAAVFILLIVGWAWFAPAAWMLGAYVFGSLLLLVVFRMMDQYERDTIEAQLRRARKRQCVGCGYDLRCSADRCPECGRRIDHADLALPAPSVKSRAPHTQAPEHPQAELILRLRPPTLPHLWRDARRAEIAAAIAAACARSAPWPNDHFLPDDSFAMMIDDWEGMVFVDVVTTVREEFGVSLEDSLERLERMTFGDVIDLVQASIERAGPSRPLNDDASRGHDLTKSAQSERSF